MAVWGKYEATERSKKQMKLPKQLYPLNGVIKFYKEDKGWGFITEESGEEYFFHISNVENPEAELVKGAKVGFMHTKASAKGLEARAITIL